LSKLALLNRYIKVSLIFLLSLPILIQSMPPKTFRTRLGDVLGESVAAVVPQSVVSGSKLNVPQVKSLPSPKPSPDVTKRTDLAVQTLDLNSAVNAWRRERGQRPLATNDKICKAAGERAGEISTDFSHDKFADAVTRNHIDYKSISENIAMNSRISASAIVDQWDKSPSHHEAMLGDWSDGCGGVNGKYAVFLFAK